MIYWLDGDMKLFMTDDLKIIEQSINYVWSNELSSFFVNKKLIEKTLILTFDKKHLYVFSRTPLDIKYLCKVQLSNSYFLYKLKHKLKVNNNDYCGWRANIQKNFLEYLPKNFAKESQLIWPRISGPLASDFLKSQHKIKTSCRPLNPYITIESYIATIIHEFGHVYFNTLYQPWHGNTKENMKMINTLIRIISNKESEENGLGRLKIKLPMHQVYSEIFAFCIEYSAAKKFWPKHLEAIDLELKKSLYLLAKNEKNKDLNFETSIFDDGSHLSAAIHGKLLMAKYKITWPLLFSAKLVF